MDNALDDVCNWLAEHPWTTRIVLAVVIRIAFYADAVLA